MGEIGSVYTTNYSPNTPRMNVMLLRSPSGHIRHRKGYGAAEKSNGLGNPGRCDFLE